MILGLFDNNILQTFFAIIILGYNIYSRIKGIYNFSMIIDDRKNNLESANKVGFLYKIKFIFYTIILLVITIFFTLQCLGIADFLNKFKIIN